MAESISVLRANMSDYGFNPGRIQQDVLAHLDVVTEGKIDVVDATNPFVFALESSTVLCSSAVDQFVAQTRKLHPQLALTLDDLYLHMSDRDYTDRFAQPSRIKVGFMFSKSEILARMVQDPTSKMKKLVIPRNSYITVADTVFSLQYPIEIRQLNHGGIQIVYDAEVGSPLEVLESNVIDWSYQPVDGIDWIFFEAYMHQFLVTTSNQAVTSATGFKMRVAYVDQFYYARVYSQNDDSSWTEIATTHSEQVYDSRVPTAVLKVLDGVLEVFIPQIYTSTGILKSNIRVDVYQTKGDISMNMGSYPPNAFVASWYAIDKKRDETIFSAPLSTLSTVAVMSNSRTLGGGNALSFEDLRYRVMQNTVGSSVLPITNAQIEAALDREGYDIVKNIDNITNRVFLATRQLPDPSNVKLITAAAAGIETFLTSLDDLVLLDTVVDNTTSVTIKPDTIYQEIGGKFYTVPSSRINAILGMTPDKIALEVTNNNYYYSPFHYVLDLSNDVKNEFEVRAYYLDSPVAKTKIFVAENDTTLLQASVKTYAVEKTATGYKLTVVLQSSDEFKALRDDEVFIQLSFVPAEEKDRAYLMGTLVGIVEETGERMYSFDLSTNYNVDFQDKLQLTKFFMYDEEPRKVGSALTNDFDVIISTSTVMDTQWVPNSVDEALGRFLLPNRIAGICQEKIRIEFGHALKTLWKRARSMASTAQYLKWDIDVPYYYAEDVYERDSEGNAVQIVNGQVVVNILHHKGDPVIDSDTGEVIYQYRKGDVKLDGSGDPIIANPRGMLQQLDIMLVEGPYWFATDTSSVSYRTEMVEIFLSWMLEDLSVIEKQTLEQSRIYFYPKAMLGEIEVLLAGGIVSTIDAGQAFTVDLYVPTNVYDNPDVREQLARATVEGISDHLTQETIALSEMLASLRDRYGDDVVDVVCTGFAGGKVNTLTVMNDGARCSLRKRLVAQSDGKLIVEEDVTINFIRHERVG